MPRILPSHTNELSKKDTKQIKKNLYETRTAVYFPFISICGKSYTTNKQFIEMVQKDNGKHLVESMTHCKSWDREYRLQEEKVEVKEVTSTPVTSPAPSSTEKKGWLSWLGLRR